MSLKKEVVFPALEKAVRETFENTLFLDFDNAVEIDTPGFDKKDQLTYINIQSPFWGKLYLVIGYKLAFELLNNLYKEKNYNVLMLLVDEVMAEICNTVTGCFLSETVPHDKEFNFSLPTCTKASKDTSVNSFDEKTFALKFSYQDKAVYCIYKN